MENRYKVQVMDLRGYGEGDVAASRAGAGHPPSRTVGVGVSEVSLGGV